jgi:formylglycine-generating enzyme required for sulfatase activity
VAKIALLVGVSEYQKSFNPLPSAVKDVEQLAGVLQDENMGDFDEVIPLINPDRTQFEEAIYFLFVNRQPDDLVLFYFSGHGMNDRNHNLYFTVPQTRIDKNKIINPVTAVPAYFLQQQLTNSLSEREVIILDCCYSGAIGKDLTAKDDGVIDIQRSLGGKGRAILTSSSGLQSSFQRDSSEISIYTQYLVEGIATGVADADGDGQISADELHHYAFQKVQEAAPAMTPQFYPVQQGYRIYIAKAPQDDPKLIYRKHVQEIINDDKDEINWETGELDELARMLLEQHRRNLDIPADEAQKIEEEVKQPLCQRFQKIKRYEKFYHAAMKKSFPIRERERKKLIAFQKLLELRDEDIVPIERRLSATQAPSKPLQNIGSVKPEVRQESSQSSSLSSLPFEVVTVNQKGEIIKQEEKSRPYHREGLGNGVNLDMMEIPRGSFLMGTEEAEIERLCKKFNWEGFKRESSQHKVQIEPFFMGKTPITQAQWREVVTQVETIERDLKPDPSRFKGDKRPVENVSWYDAIEFCARLLKLTGQNYRLPSEAEWEYACRAGTKTPFHFGETITTDLANYNGDYTFANEPKGKYREETTPVDEFAYPNAFGLYDMHGNVWEWCLDPWHENYEGAPTDGKVWDENDNDYQNLSQNLKKLLNKNIRTSLRGGSWNVYPDDCRASNRYHNTRAYHVSNFGFRVVFSRVAGL